MADGGWQMADGLDQRAYGVRKASLSISFGATGSVIDRVWGQLRGARKVQRTMMRWECKWVHNYSELPKGVRVYTAKQLNSYDFLVE